MMQEQMDRIAAAKGRTRRHYDTEFKQRVLAECAEPGASVARIALSHGINANLVHAWRQEARHKTQQAGLPISQDAFVPLALPAPETAPVPGDIRIELRRGATTVSVTWPLAAVEQSAAWVREILR